MRPLLVRLPLVACLAMGLSVQARGQLSVDIVQPLDGATVAGPTVISGTSSGLVSGQVSVSIDGGPFQLAPGQAAWSIPWDTTAFADGPHTVTARARECIGCPSVTDSISVTVANAGGLGVTILEPVDGTLVISTLTVAGISSGADAVTISVDGGAPTLANGTDSWTVVLEEGSMVAGPHVLTATASAGAVSVQDSVSIVVDDPVPGTQSFSYASSVDGEVMTSALYVPVGFDPDGPPVPLVVQLHGGGGLGGFGGGLSAGLDEHGWLGIAPDGRVWGLAEQGCNWQTSAAYVDSPDPAVGPGEQDIFDAIDWAVAHLPVDTDRIYLTGFSMGGRGTYGIGLRNPDVFAAIGPRGPASDMYEVFVRRPEPCECKQGMVGGPPDESPFVDTMYTITSGRFLIENAYNVPVFHGHGTQDSVAANDLAFAPYMHGWHMTADPSFAAAHVTPPDFSDSCLEDLGVLPISLDFGHTPTLAELAAAHPEGYDWAYCFTPVEHSSDPFWITGGPMQAGHFGTPDPAQPGQLLGMFDFFAARSLVHDPATVVFKTYTDVHRRAFWATLDITTPWLDLPGALRATPDAAANALDVELVRAQRAGFDLARVGLSLTGGAPLEITLQPLVDPVFDPALSAVGEVLAPVIELRGDLADLTAVEVLRDGVPLAAGLVSWDDVQLSVGPLVIDGPTVLSLVGTEGAWVDLGGGLAGVSGVPGLSGGGTLAPLSNGSVDLVAGAPSAPAGLFVALDSQPVPFKGGQLLAFPVLTLLDVTTQADGGFSLPFVWPGDIPPGTGFVLQAAVADGAAVAGVSLSNGLQGTTPSP